MFSMTVWTLNRPLHKYSTSPTHYQLKYSTSSGSYWDIATFHTPVVMPSPEDFTKELTGKNNYTEKIKLWNEVVGRYNNNKTT